MKYIQCLCWVMVLVWLSTVAFNSVYEIYATGGLWRLAAWFMVVSGILIWAASIWSCFKIIHEGKKGMSEKAKDIDG